MSLRTSAWVDTRASKVRPSAAVAADVADAWLALESTDPAVTRRFLRAILERAEGLLDGGISVADAADALGISSPTVRNWLAHGVLDRAGSTSPVKITESSLGEAIAAVATIRELEGENRKMRLVLDALDDRRTRERLADSIAELAAGDYAEVDVANIGELFE